MRLTPGVFQLVSLLLAPLAALAGVWLGPHLTSRIELNRWKRDRKEQAYLALLQAVDSLRLHVMEETTVSHAVSRVEEEMASEKDAGSQSHELRRSDDLSLEEARTFAKQYVRESARPYEALVRARSQTELFGTRRVLTLFDTTTDYYMALRVSPSNAETERIGLAAYNAVQELINECRRDLGLPSQDVA
jgi:hypothetical protein